MKCFNHRELDAIAVCMRCGRALCSECIGDVGGMVACLGRCEPGIAATLQLLQSSRQRIELQAPVYRWLAYFLYVIGVGSLGFAAFVGFSGNFGPPEGLLVGWGLIAVIGGVVSHRHAKTLQSKDLAP